MLSESEGRRLANLEACLGEDDPEFVRRFAASWGEPSGVRLDRWWLFCIDVLLVVLALLVLDVAVLVLALGTTVALAWLTSGRGRPGRRRLPPSPR